MRSLISQTLLVLSTTFLSPVTHAATLDLTELLFGPGRGEIIIDFKKGLAKRTAIFKCAGVHEEARIYETDPGFVLGRGTREFWNSFRDYHAIVYRTKMDVILYNNGVASMKAALGMPGLNVLDQASMHDISSVRIKSNANEMLIAGETSDHVFPDRRNPNLQVTAAAVKLPKTLKVGQSVTTLARYALRVPVGRKFGYGFRTTNRLVMYSLMQCKRVE